MMTKVIVELDEVEKKQRRLSVTDGSNNSHGAPRYEGWVTADYVAAQLLQDVAHFWQLDPTKYDLIDGVADSIVADDTRLDELAATSYRLQKRRVIPVDDARVIGLHQSRNDPFWLQEKLFDVFLIHSLPHWNGKGSLTISCYQFKQLVLKAMAQSASSKTTRSKPTHDLTVRIVLAFKTASPNCSGAGATFDEFLDALMDVAAYVFARAITGSKEYALEQLTQMYLIPYCDHLEHSTVHDVFLSWSTIDELVLVRPKVQQLLHRFAQPLFEVALAYTTSVAGPRCQRGLQFHEFSRLVHDTKPSSLPLTTLELCFCFIHCCRIELANGFTATPTTAGATGALDPRGSLASLHTGTDGSGRGVLEISCAHVGHALAYLALLSLPRLAHAKPLPSSLDNQGHRSHDASNLSEQRGRVSSAIAVLSIKAFLHFMSLRLASTGRATATAVASASPRFASMKKDTTLPLVSVHFLQEFRRMHREDALVDYLSSCGERLRQDTLHEQREDPQQQDKTDAPTDDALRPEEEEEETAKTTQDLNDEFGLEIDWGEEGSEESGEQSPSSGDEESSPLTQESAPMSPEEMARRHTREKEVLQSMVNDADEIYTFLVSELKCLAMESRLDDTDTVPQMLDIWVTAGQKYAQVLNYLDSLSHEATEQLLDRKVRVLERFGTSLYVFAIQLLKSTSTVFEYEEIFDLTNARVYTHLAAGQLWEGRPCAAFTVDLATETLSLASGKLGTASKLLEELHGLSCARVKRRRDHSMTESNGNEDANSDDEPYDDDEIANPSSVTGRYIQSLYHRANCLDIYGDVLGHAKCPDSDFDLGCTLEDEDQEKQLVSSSASSSSTHESTTFQMPLNVYNSSAVLSKTSTAGHFYREAMRIYRFLLDETTRLRWHDANDRFMVGLSDRLANVEFKLASHLPRGCLAEKHLLDHAFHRLSALSCSDVDGAEKDRVLAKRAYVSAIRALRTKFFQSETDKSAPEAQDSDAIVPFYRFVLVAALREIDPARTGFFTQGQLSHFNEICGRGAVTNSVMAWLVRHFDHHVDASLSGLTEKGVFQYFSWLAEADPLTFCDVLDLLTAKYTETPVSITSGIVSHTGRECKAKSLRATFFTQGKQRSLASMVTSTGSVASQAIAECVVVVAAKMTLASCGDISQTASPCEVKLEPSVVDVLPLGADVPDELSKFCFPDDLFMSNEPLPPKAFDIVLTDITGARQYGSCLHFTEERDPIDVLAMISGIQRGNRTASLPSWISLKDIQQRKAKIKFFVPKCVCILSRRPLFQTLRDCLATVYRLSISSPPFPVESFLFHILEQIPVPPTPSHMTSFSLVDKIGLLTALPPAVPPLFPHEVDFTLLFQCLSAENILKVYGFLLTEKKLVLCSQNVSILTPCAETLRALLHPFESQVVYIPVLPLALLDFVTAPVPFFMGVSSDHSIDRLTGEGVVVVNLDKDEVVEPSSEVLPALPESRAKKLLQALRKASSWAACQPTRRNFGRYQHGELAEIASFTQREVSETEVLQMLQQQEDVQEKWTDLYILFTTFVMRLLKDFRKYCRRTTNAEGRETTKFDEKGFLAMHPSRREFCVHLFQTQHFQRFVDTTASLSESLLQLAVSDAEQSWRNVRSKTIMSRRDSGDAENAKTPPRQITRAPTLIQTAAGSLGDRHSGGHHRRRPSGRHAIVEILPPFNSQIYDELHGITNKQHPHSPNAETTVTGTRPPLLSHGSSDTIRPSTRSSLHVSPALGSGSSSLIFAARMRLDIPVDIADAEQ